MPPLVANHVGSVLKKPIKPLANPVFTERPFQPRGAASIPSRLLFPSQSRGGVRGGAQGARAPHKFTELGKKVPISRKNYANLA